MSSPKAVPSNAPRVSVLVTTFQHAKYIEQCLEGILMQRTAFPVEILVGEDESTDGTREICQRYAAEHPGRIRLFLRDRKDVIYINGKPSGRSNMKRLLADATGKYVALCEGDDHWIDPLKLQKQVEVLEGDPGLAMCFHNAWVKHAESRRDRFLNHGLQGSRFSFEDLVRNDWFIATASILIKREHVVDAFTGTDHYISGDMLLQLHAARRGDVAYVDEVMSVYHRHEGGLSDGMWRSEGGAHAAWQAEMGRLWLNHVWMFMAFGVNVQEDTARRAIRARVLEILRRILNWEVVERMHREPLRVSGLRTHLLQRLEGARPEGHVATTGPGSELVRIVDNAVHLAWLDNRYLNRKAMAGQGRLVDCLRVDLDHYRERVLPRSEVVLLALRTVGWWLLALVRRPGGVRR